MLKRYKHILIIFLQCAFTLALHAQLSVAKLQCEWLTNPTGIDVIKPRLSWQLPTNTRDSKQTAYQVLVASSPVLLQKNQADIWNSGKINSEQSIHVPYAGKPLQSGKAYYWKVKSFTNKNESAWSETGSWSMGLLQKSDWHAKWIGYDKASAWDSITTWSRLSARYLRKEFQLNKSIKRATVYVSGLGLYQLFLNGNKVGNDVLAPAPTDYRKSVLYNTYDITNALKNGDNAVAVVLGNGRYFTMRQAYKPQKINTFGYPKLLLQIEIEYTDGSKKSVVSDESWKLNVDGPIRTNNEYDGEEYDATKEWNGWATARFNEAGWMQPQLVQAPAGILRAQMSQHMKIKQSIQPIAIKKLDDKTWVMDMGQNFAGWVRMKVRGNRNDKVVLRFAESLKPDGSLYVANLRDARVTDSYTLKGDGEEIWEPAFVYHGFRYVEIKNYPGEPKLTNFEGELVFDDLNTAGSFACSDPTITGLVKNAWWGIASDYKGMPVDCPQRNERQPWLGDRATGCSGESFLFNNAALYSKWLDDIEESQTTEGAIPDVAPAFWNYYSDNVTWPGTYILVADMLHRQFGDERGIVKHYASMKKWLAYMKAKYMQDYIVTKDKYGDWCVPPESLELIHSKDSLRITNGALMATAYYYRLLQIMKRFAIISGQNADVSAFDALAGNIKIAFNKKFFNANTAQYDNNSVTANLLPLYFEMAPAESKAAIFNNIYEKVRAGSMHISTGVIGTQWLMRGLTNYGRADDAFTMASNTSYPSWGYMLANGATTIWELWNGNTANPQMNSQNHVMLLGDLLIWIFENLGGIQSNDATPAFKEITMRPSFVKGLNSVNAAYESPYGKIVSEWTKKEDRLNWTIDVPANSSALVYIPAAAANAVMESGKEAGKAEGLQFIFFKNGEACYRIGSGHYQFTSTIK